MPGGACPTETNNASTEGERSQNSEVEQNRRTERDSRGGAGTGQCRVRQDGAGQGRATERHRGSGERTAAVHRGGGAAGPAGCRHRLAGAARAGRPGGGRRVPGRAARHGSGDRVSGRGRAAGGPGEDRRRRPSGRCTRTGRWCGCTACGTPCSCSPPSSTAVVHASTGLAVAARERAALVKDMAKAGAPDAAWLAEVEESALAALARRGQATAAELAQDEPRLREQFVYAAGKSYEGVHTVSTRLLRVLGVEGKVVRGRPLGSWTSTQFRWAVAPAHPELDVAEAQAELLRRWLARVRAGHGGGPEVVDGLEGDRGTRRALAAIGRGDRVGGRGRRGTSRRRRRSRWRGPPSRGRRCCPALDPTAMGWQRAGLVSGAGAAAVALRPQRERGPDGVVERAGRRRVGPAAGRRDRLAVAGHRGCGRRGAEAAVAVEAARVRGWVGAARVTPRFRTPLERELASA